MADPRTEKYAKTALEEVALWKEGMRHIFFYACEGGKKLNIAGGHPDTTLTTLEGQSKGIIFLPSASNMYEELLSIMVPGRYLQPTRDERVLIRNVQGLYSGLCAFAFDG
jgi:hypothetical protein